jgi:hypothetical protein
MSSPRRPIALSIRPPFIFALLATLLLGAAAPAPSSGPAPTVDRVGFPADYQKTFQVLRTFNRAKPRNLITVYANPPAAAVADSGDLPYPHGSVFVMEFAEVPLGPDGHPLFDAKGRFQKGKVTSLHVMRHGEKFGEAYGPLRTGEWEYVEYRPDGTTLTAPKDSFTCAACHLQAGAARDWVYRGRFEAEETMK